MIGPPPWTEDQLNDQRAAAQDIFRQERIQGPLEDYLEAFDELQGVVEDLLETTIDLSTLNETAVEVLTQPALPTSPEPPSLLDIGDCRLTPSTQLGRVVPILCPAPSVEPSGRNHDQKKEKWPQ